MLLLYNMIGKMVTDHTSVLQKRGFKRRLVEADCSSCYTVEDFAREYPRGIYVLGCSGHVLAVVNGEWIDSWDSGAECPIYYWYKED